ncbi:MAG TPA: diguanylate cyclase [Pseudomonadales bacterium]|nr:diguanylate cyclase [Pseudomonadales bacterium]
MTRDANSLIKVLVVEDDQSGHVSLLLALRNRTSAIVITESNSVADACGKLQAQEVDVVLTEYRLMDGCASEILSQIDSIACNKPAVVVIGEHDDDALAVQCIMSGAQAYLAKETIKPSTLVSTIVQARQHALLQESLRAKAERLQSLAEHDSLTGLYNRHIFDEHLQLCLAQAERYGKPFALLMIDLDQFKMVNDTWGHCVGDELLRQIAERLCSVTRDSDRVCRIGGDEFAIVLPEITHDRQPAILAERLAEALKAPVCIDTADILVTASIGIAIYPENGATADELLRNADQAMYRCKRQDSTTCPDNTAQESRPE